jgi:replication initiation protein RepC
MPYAEGGELGAKTLSIAIYRGLLSLRDGIERACPDIVDSAKRGISNWRDFLATAAVVRSMLGISPSAWEEAQTVLGETQAAVVVACILLRGTTIRSAGGYLRGLTRKAEVGSFPLGLS